MCVYVLICAQSKFVSRQFCQLYVLFNYVFINLFVCLWVCQFLDLQCYVAQQWLWLVK